MTGRGKWTILGSHWATAGYTAVNRKRHQREPVIEREWQERPQ